MNNKEVAENYIVCSSCDHVLDCEERGKHKNCINYVPINKESKDVFNKAREVYL